MLLCIPCNTCNRSIILTLWCWISFQFFVGFEFKTLSKIFQIIVHSALMGGHFPMWLLSAVVFVTLSSVNSELTPPYFNLAEGRKILASSTCGVDIDGPELYCKLVGSHTDDQQNKTLFDYHDDHFHTAALSRQGHVVIQGQVRSYHCLHLILG